MLSQNRSNLVSPNGISTPVNLSNLESWIHSEARNVQEPTVERLILGVFESLELFVKWPSKARLLVEGMDRIVAKGKKTKYHKYPDEIKREARQLGIPLDSRANGPAISAFLMAGGERPARYGSNNGWSIHHIYSGKFPYIDKRETLHAAQSGLHFTQSAGLVAVHPIADQMCDEYPFFSWLLRALAFQKFGYDPDNVFSQERISTYGFC